MKLKITILTEYEIKKRYSKINRSKEAEKTFKALEEGQFIVLVEHQRLKSINLGDLINDIKSTLQDYFGSDYVVTLKGYTDFSQFDNGKLYCSVYAKRIPDFW